MFRIILASITPCSRHSSLMCIESRTSHNSEKLLPQYSGIGRTIIFMAQSSPVERLSTEVLLSLVNTYSMNGGPRSWFRVYLTRGLLNMREPCCHEKSCLSLAGVLTWYARRRYAHRPSSAVKLQCILGLNKSPPKNTRRDETAYRNQQRDGVVKCHGVAFVRHRKTSP